MSYFKARVLSDFDGNRQNNFTSIRILLAWLVLYGHSFAIQKLPGVRDPLNQIFQGSVWVGEIAVNGFFAISGFLVAASFARRGWKDYTISRALRIYPALAVCVFLSAMLLGPLTTTLSTVEYFSTNQSWQYLRNALAFFPMRWELPGVFAENPRQAINGSLWTLTVEVLCYLYLGVLALTGVLKSRWATNILLLSVAILGYFSFDQFPLIGRGTNWARPATYFLVGVALYINRRNIPIHGGLALLVLVATLYTFGKPLHELIFPVCLPYMLFYLAYGTRYLDTDGTVGDISYGIYIYAWPMQQVVNMAAPTAHPYVATIFASMIVIPLAYCSWHFLEKPVLGMKVKLLKKQQ